MEEVCILNVIPGHGYMERRMTKIILDIQNCNECPNYDFPEHPCWGEMSCNKSNDRIIAIYDNKDSERLPPPIPDWCPCRAEKVNPSVESLKEQIKELEEELRASEGEIEEINCQSTYDG